MKIGLIDVDGHSNFPNLALMKLASWHKDKGDSVEWYSPMFSGHMDKVYMSKVFTFTPDYPYYIDADEVVKSGTGYKDYETVLSDEIEHIFPDYSIYPGSDYAVGFMTRGCIRNCPWCIVPKKEGKLRPNETWKHIIRTDSNWIKFLDNNVLGSDFGIHQIEDLPNVYIDFNQGLDARLIDDSVAKILARCRWKRYLRMSCDTTQLIHPVEKAVNRLTRNGLKPYKISCYVLVQDVEEAYERIMALNKLGINIFAQPYRDFDGGEPTVEQKRFARWCNMKAIFKTVKWEDYRSQQ